MLLKILFQKRESVIISTDSCCSNDNNDHNWKLKGIDAVLMMTVVIRC